MAWLKTEDQQWQPLTRARFTADANPVTNIDAGIEKQRFFLATGGPIENTTVKLWQHIDLDSKAERKAPEDLPVIASPSKRPDEPSGPRR